MGAKKKPVYRVVVVDSRKRRNSDYLECVGHVNLRTDPKRIQLDRAKIEAWVEKGAQLSPTVARLLEAKEVSHEGEGAA